MVRMIEVDADNLVKIMKDAAEEHGWCEVADDLLVKAGLLTSTKHTGVLNLQIPVTDFRIDVDENASDEEKIKWINEHVTISVLIEDDNAVLFENRNTSEVLVSLGEPVDKDAEWFYTSSQGQVLHKVTSGSFAACGDYLSPYARTKISSRVTGGRRCNRCVTASSN